MIEKYYLFSLLSPAEAKIIEKRLLLKPYDKGTVIFEENDSADALYFIQKGEVELFKMVRDKPTQSMMILKDGNFFGEVEHIDDAPRYVTAKANTDVECLLLLKSDFERILGDDPAIKHKIYKSFMVEMSRRLRIADERFKDFFKKALKS